MGQIFELKMCKSGKLRSRKVELNSYIQQFNTMKYAKCFNRGSLYLNESDKIEFCNFLNGKNNFSGVKII
jgi:hypothetical protein